jgi:serine/threonine protein kinase
MTSQTIDRYEVREQLGLGGMATVYHAYDPHFGRDVAMIVASQHPPVRPVYESASRGRNSTFCRFDPTRSRFPVF